MGLEAIKIQTVGDNQIIKLPLEFRIDADEVYLKKSGNIIQIIPLGSAWQDMFDSLDDFSDDFMENRDQNTQESRDGFD